MRLAAWISARVAAAAATLAVLSAVVFWATEVLPGDAVGVLSGQDATEAERDAVRAALGLDRPAAARYLDWGLSALQGDLGRSLISGRDVAEIVAARLSTSLAVLVPATIGIALVATILGAVTGIRAGSRFDRILSALTLGTIAVPDFLIATALLTILTTWIRVLPAVVLVPAGESIWQHPGLVVLPALALVLGGSAPTLRVLRASIAQTCATPFAEFARLNGVRGLRYVRVVLVNAAGPAIQTFAVMTAGLLGGTIVVETLVNLPGMGYELTRAIAHRDVPLVQGLSLVLGAAALAILLAGDIGTRLLHERTVGERT